MRDVNLDNEVIRESVEYDIRLQRGSSTDRFGSSGEKGSGFVLVSGGEEKGGSLGPAKALLLFTISIRERNERKDCAFLQYMGATMLIDTVDDELG